MLRELALDDELVQEAKDVGRHKTEAEAVTAALQEYIDRRRQQQILELFGKIDYDPAYDYKEQRRHL
ncbi:MAG: type II toxin-antitoxin system VapB family antitoxin [Anaerolineae bacterium]|nr:type II toxin-antitoxin system VapB family antitoxin [Anaerolineae bacterium]HNS40815.1 type II toxin-antitoxin system VapB family antitoxin [Promineifilum sp.]